MRSLHPELFNKDFIDFLHCWNDASVDSILVGGYAVVLHGYNRTTGDMDIWVAPTPGNFRKLRQALSAFGLPTDAISESAFLSTEDQDVFTFGRPPVAIDILTQVKGLSFTEAFAQAEAILIDGAPVHLLHLNDLKAAKRAAGRHKDLDDLENLGEAID